MKNKRIDGLLQDYVKDNRQRDIIVHLFLECKYEEAIILLKEILGQRWRALFTACFKIFACKKDERLFNLICRELLSAASDVTHINFNSKLRWIYNCFYHYVFKIRKQLPQSIIENAARCLEYLWAYGVNGIEKLIVDLYQSIDLGVRPALTDLYLAKELSCVYIVDTYNYQEVNRRVEAMHERIKSGEYKYLKGPLYYYTALLLRYKQKSYILYCPGSVNKKLEKSLKHHFELAAVYNSHRNKLRNFEEI